MQFVLKSIPTEFFVRLVNNNRGETPKEIFTRTLKDLANEGRQWLTKTSEAYSVVAALIVTVAYGASTTLPEGFNEENGKPVLRDNFVFNVFAVSSLVALCFSVTAFIFFLTILNSRYQETDFAYSQPRKFFFGLTSHLTSVVAIIISFCSGHSFILKGEFAMYTIYIATCLPLTYFAFEQLPFYFDLLRATFTNVPKRGY